MPLGVSFNTTLAQNPQQPVALVALDEHKLYFCGSVSEMMIHLLINITSNCVSGKFGPLPAGGLCLFYHSFVLV